MSTTNTPRPVLCLAVALALLSAPALAAGDAPKPLALRAADPALDWGPCPPVFPGKCEIAVLQGDPARPGADVFLRVAGGQALPPHTHGSAERMILVEGELAVTYRGYPQAVLTPGSYAYGPPGMPHWALCRSSGPCTLFIAFVGPVDAVAHTGGTD